MNFQKLFGAAGNINKAAAFVAGLDGVLPSADQPFSLIINSIDAMLRAQRADVPQNALSNAHGAWYEWLVALSAKQFHFENPSSFVAVPLPSVKSFDIGSLYEIGLHAYIQDLRLKVKQSAAVNLITSNPDFAIINIQNLEQPPPFHKSVDTITVDSLAELGTLYQFFQHKCGFETIRGYAGLKYSLRPDRRLQWPHEGSLMKALYRHLQTRLWMLDPPGINYYGLTPSPGAEDFNAMATVATHSITTVLGKPERAVDELFGVDSINQAYHAFEVMLFPRTPDSPMTGQGD